VAIFVCHVDERVWEKLGVEVNKRSQPAAERRG